MWCVFVGMSPGVILCVCVCVFVCLCVCVCVCVSHDPDSECVLSVFSWETQRLSHTK